MSTLTQRLEQEADKLRTKRDELRVQIDLGKKDFEDVWEEAEAKFGKLEAHVARLKKEGDEAVDDIGEAADLLVDEIKRHFKGLRELL